MDNRIKLQAGCMLIILFMAIIYFRTKRVKSYSHILFSISLGTMIFNLCFDMTTVYTVNHMDTVPPIANWVCHILFLGSLIMEVFLCYLYCVVLIHKDGVSGDCISKRKLWLWAIPVWIAWFGLLFLPIRYVETTQGNYSWGPAVFTVHGTVALYIVCIVLTMIRHWKEINSKKRFVVALAFLIQIVVLVYQTIFPASLVSGFGLTLINLAFFLTVESPDMLLMEQLRVEKERADDANAAKSQFLSTMSHEIRTPMNAIVGMTDILLREELPQNTREYLNNIKNSGDALLTIINDILDFSKIESGKLEIIEEDYEPMSMFHDLSMIFLNRIGSKPVELLYDIDPKMPTKLHGDGQRLRQIVINLMNNAIKFTDSGFVKLKVRVEESSEESVYLKFEVQDTGQGIKEEDIGKLFASFQQVDTKKNRSKEGTGLGLAICKQLVELMDGEIGVQSVYGEGSTFYFRLPQKVVNAKPAARVKDAGRKSRIALRIVNPVVKEQIAAMAGAYQISCTEWGKDAGEQADFLITDSIQSISEEERKRLHDSHGMFCVLQNPMLENVAGKDVTVINKPLYSLNFCQLINHEELVYQSAVEENMNFTAPQASILVVDDNEMNRKVAKGLMAPYQMQIDMAEDGKQAVEMVQRKHYDIVFMDHMMPVMDGLEATAAIRALDGEYYQKLPIIALSANATSEAQELFVSGKMDGFIAKPIRTKELAKCILSWLPEDMIVPSETDTAAPGGKVSLKDAASGLPADDRIANIEGLDVAEGLKNCGSKELFLELLGDFYRLIEPKCEKLELFLREDRIRDYTIEVHALKNAARMIGAMELSQKFYRMEQLGNEEKKEEILAEFPALLELYRSYETTLADYGKTETEGTEQVSVTQMCETLMQLHDAVDGFDLDAADEAMKKLEGYAFSPEIKPMVEQLGTYVRDVAMEDVMRLTRELCDRLNAEGA